VRGNKPPFKRKAADALVLLITDFKIGNLFP
jgi:hypothetical protein